MQVMNECRLEFPSRSSNEAFARVAAAAFAAQLDPTLEELEDVKTAVSEAVTRLKMRFLEGGLLEIAVQDWGKGIEDVEKARAPLFTTGGEERGGMGFTIMESFTDKLRVRSRPGRGTVVIMQRQIRSRARRT